MKDGSLYKFVIKNGGWNNSNYSMFYITTNNLETFRDTHFLYIL